MARLAFPTYTLHGHPLPRLCRETGRGEHRLCGQQSSRNSGVTRSSLPRHDRDRGKTVEGGTLHHPDPPVFLHLLTSPTPADNSLASSLNKTPCGRTLSTSTLSSGTSL